MFWVGQYLELFTISTLLRYCVVRKQNGWPFQSPLLIISDVLIVLVYKVQHKEKKLPSVHVLCIPVKGRSNCRKKRTLWHHQWRRPLPLRLTFWKKLIGDRETFKLMLFCLGNGCSPPLISTWILLSQTWAPDKAEKRAWQLDYVLNNPEAERNMVLLWPRPQQTFVFKWITETAITAPTRCSRKT